MKTTRTREAGDDTAPNRPLPHDPAAEKAILGSIILHNPAALQAEVLLKSDNFHDRVRRIMFDVMIKMSRENIEINPITLSDAMKRAGTPVSMTTIDDLTYGLPHFASIKHYAKLVKDRAAERFVMQLCDSIALDVWNGELDATTAANRIDEQLQAVRDLSGEKRGLRTMAEVAEDGLKRVADLREGINPAIPYTLPSLDAATNGGNLPTELVIISALTGGGKSALMKQMAMGAARQGIHSAIFTIEMADIEVLMRMASAEARVPNWKISVGRDAKVYDELAAGIQRIGELPIYIDDRTTNLYELRARIKELLRRDPDVQVVYVDYLQLLDVRAEDWGRFQMTRQQEVATCSKMLKRIAKEFGIVIVALAQFNREATRKNKDGSVDEPTIHQLAEGGIEKDADTVIIIDLEPYVTGQAVRKAVIRFGKRRNGAQFSIQYLYNGDFMEFLECDADDPEGSAVAHGLQVKAPKAQEEIFP